MSIYLDDLSVLSLLSPSTRRDSEQTKQHSKTPRYHDEAHLPPTILTLSVLSHMQSLSLSTRSNVECVSTDVDGCNGKNLVVGRLETGGSCLIQGQCLGKSGVRRIQRDCGIGVLCKFGSAYETYSSPVNTRLTMRCDGAVTCVCLTLDSCSPTLRLAGRG